MKIGYIFILFGYTKTQGVPVVNANFAQQVSQQYSASMKLSYNRVHEFTHAYSIASKIHQTKCKHKAYFDVLSEGTSTCPIKY